MNIGWFSTHDARADAAVPLVHACTHVHVVMHGDVVHHAVHVSAVAPVHHGNPHLRGTMGLQAWHRMLRIVDQQLIMSILLFIDSDKTKYSTTSPLCVTSLSLFSSLAPCSLMPQPEATQRSPRNVSGSSSGGRQMGWMWLLRGTALRSFSRAGGG